MLKNFQSIRNERITRCHYETILQYGKFYRKSNYNGSITVSFSDYFNRCIHIAISWYPLICMNAMKLVIPLHSLYWSIHTKDESKRGTAFAFIFGVN